MLANGHQPLSAKVALVAGATRGAGRAFAVELAAAGATVYATGRSSENGRSEMGRPETIEGTATRAAEAGGKAVPVVCDHLEPSQVRALVSRIESDQGRLNILVNNIWGGDHLTGWDAKLWEHDLDAGLRILQLAIDTHIITSHAAIPLLSLSRGWIRSEAMLEHFGVTEDNRRDGTAKDPHFCITETPHYVARAAVALAADPDKARFNGQSLASWDLGPAYGVTDLDGTQPHFRRYHREVIKAGKPADDTGYR